jgi:hypothetical protein
MYNRETERQQYEDWHRHGRERGWFDRASDEFRSWFGDEEAERRRRMDQMDRDRYDRGRDRGWGSRHDREDGERNYSSLPVWQQRDYSGPSPRGAEVEERGRFDMEYERGRDHSRRAHWSYGGSGFDDDDYGSEYGGNRYGTQGRYGYSNQGRSGYGTQGRFGSQNRSYMRDNDISEQLDRYGRGREEYGGMRQGGGYGRRFFGEREDYQPMYRGGERGGLFGGMHQGRGPRNFQRSDERISDEIHQILTFHPEIDATDIEILVDKGIVTLRGKVDNRMSKRLSEDLVEDVYGVREVRNELRVDQGLFQTREEANDKQRNNLLKR